jgi:hypothetical protein
MGDRVRLLRSADPLGYVQGWLDKIEETVALYNFPFTEKTFF